MSNLKDGVMSDDKNFDMDQYLEQRFFTIPSNFSNEYRGGGGRILINEYVIDLEEVVHIQELSLQYSSKERSQQFKIYLYLRGKRDPLCISIKPEDLESIYKKLKTAWLYVRKASIPLNKKFKGWSKSG